MACDPEEGLAETVGKVAGFSLPAGVAARADERQNLDCLCRTISRPAVSETRFALTATGKLRSQLETPSRDGTTHVIFEASDFIARLVSLVPKPRVNPGSSPGQALTRIHGVLASNSKHRVRVTPAKRGKAAKP